ncbi:hypothetical protein [Paenibacillus sp. V4I5]|uniref:hypothetical protein n=1 Tax=Paenibacillus sp. V4I5 TaxID=3042306 RepID=UPI00278E0479|nr:hypothetical protein [Paenibacillus sp. V4I5]MDQ0917019.1 hypothetical protein [Paenibacillus sp. V4I5]
MVKKNSFYLIFLLISVFVLTGCSIQTGIEKEINVQEENKSALKVDINPKGWEVSPTFNIPVTFGDGTKGEYILIGNEGELGFLTGGQPIIAGKSNKYMWYFWGSTLEETQQLFGKKMEIRGVSKQTGEEISVFKGGIGIPNPNVQPPILDNDKVAKGVTMMSIPSGLWRLDAYIEEKLFGSVVAQVHNK